MSGYASAIAGEEVRARETACRACGSPACVFEVTRAAATSTG